MQVQGVMTAYCDCFFEQFCCFGAANSDREKKKVTSGSPFVFKADEPQILLKDEEGIEEDEELDISKSGLLDVLQTSDDFKL